MAERSLHFSKSIYAGKQVDAAINVYAPYAEIERAEEPGAWVVKIVASSEGRAKKLEGELANYALGLTIRARKAVES
ncbi:MAG: HxsD-like protein [Myxococcota bacterium]